MQHFSATSDAARTESRALRRLAKETAERVRKQWRLVHQILFAKHKQLVALEEKSRGKKHLFDIIQQSSRVLQDQQAEMCDSVSLDSDSDDSETHDDLGDLMNMVDDDEDEDDAFSLGHSSLVSDKGSEMDVESEDELSANAAVLVPPLIKHTLRDYQLHGLKWLLGTSSFLTL